MFTYDAYKNRIKKIAAVRHFIFRFKVPIIVVLSLIVAAVTTLLCTKGMITTDFAAPNSVTYGTDYEVGGAKAFLSDINAYEYKAAGESEWTRTKPVYAGKYEVRAVTKGAFGYKYSGAKSFEILPVKATLDILDESVTYGDNPKNIEIKLDGEDASANKLLYTDRLSASSLEFTYADFTSENTSVQVAADSIAVFNTSGVNVTHCYDISTSSHDIKFLPRPVSVHAAQCELVYSGAPQAFVTNVTSATENQLANGDIVRYEVEVVRLDARSVKTRAAAREAYGEDGNPLDVGNYLVRIKEGSVRIFKGDIEVTARYDLDIPFENVRFAITPREIQIATADASKIYDGTPLTSAEFTHGGEVAGHEVRVYDCAALTEARTVSNTCSVRIEDENRRDVTHNYNIRTTYGNLTVTKRPISVSTETDSKTYDGTPLVNTRFTHSGEADGHTVGISNSADITDVGTRDNTCVAMISDSMGRDVTANYDISYTFGTLTVNKRALGITTDSNTEKLVYNGGGFALPQYSVTSGSVAPNQQISVTDYTTVTEAGGHDNILGFDIIANNGYGGSVLKNYELEVTFGTLTVSKRKISFNAGSGSWVYDGKPHSITKVTDGDFVSGHYAEVKSGVNIISVTKVSESGKANGYAAADYAIYDKSGKDMSPNYEITAVTAGVLKIEKREITVVSLDRTWVYDGAAHEQHDFDYAFGSLAVADGETFAVLKSTAITNAGSDTNTILSYEIKCADGTDSLGNYAVNLSNVGTVTVTRRPLVLTMNSNTKVYDATPLFDGGFTYEENMQDRGLVSGHAVTHSVQESALPYIVDFGSIDNVLDAAEFTVKANNADVTANYNISVNSGTLGITKRPITFKSKDKSFVYDGEAHHGTEDGNTVEIAFDITAGSLVNGHKSFATAQSYATNVSEGTVGNVLRYEITDASGNAYSADNRYLTDNYEITTVSGGLTVTPRPLRITTHTKEDIVYDGADHTFPWFTYDSDGVNYLDIVSGHTLDITTVTVNEVVFDNTGSETTVSNALVSGDAWDISGTDKSNYSLKVTEGTLKVLRRPLSVSTEDAEKEYDGTPLTCTDYSPKNIVTGHAIGVDTTKAIASITDVGTAINKLEFYIRNAAGEDVIVNYYITYTYGILTVTPRNLIVKVKSKEWEYDGTAHYFDEADFEHSGDSDFGLVSGHTYESTSGKIYITNVWESGIDENTYTYKILSGTADVTRNYNFVRTDFGRLTVTPREITVTRHGEIKEYDGTPLVGNKFSVDRPNGKSDDALVSSAHKLIPDGEVTELTNVGEVFVTTQYIVTCDTVSNINRNYRIVEYFTSANSNDGNLTITPRLIRITTPTVGKVFDGESFSATEGEIVEHIDSDGNPDGKVAFVLGHKQRLTESSVTSITHVYQTVGGNNKLAFTVVGANGETTTDDGYIINDNYYITYVYGTLAITPRPMNITNESITKVYDDKYFFDTVDPVPEYFETRNNDRGLLEDLEHKLIAKEDTIVDFRDASSKQNTVDYIVYDPNETYNGGDISEDYTISYTPGTLTISKRPITVETPTEVWEYDGEEHRGIERNGLVSRPATENSGLVGSHYINATFITVTKITDVGTIANTTRCDIMDYSQGPENIRKLTDNYDITYIDGPLEVTPRNVKVYVASSTGYPDWEYDGEPHGIDDCTFVHVVKDESGEWTADGDFGMAKKQQAIREGDLITVTNVRDGIKENKYSYKIYRWADYDEEHDIWLDELGGWAKDVTFNYNIVDTIAGTIEITPRKIEVRTESDSRVYDGTPLVNGNATAWHQDESGTWQQDGLVNGHTLTAVTNPLPGITDVGTVENVIAYKVDDGFDSTNYWIENYEYGFLTVETRYICVVTDTAEWTYDGKAHSSDKVTYSVGSFDESGNNVYLALADGQEFVVSESTEITDAGSTANEITKYDILAGGESVLSNYHVDFVYGTLTVNRRTLYVRPKSFEKTYDGEYFEYPFSTDSTNFEYYTADPEHMAVSEDRLIRIDVYFAKDGESIGGLPINAGEYEIRINALYTERMEAAGKLNYTFVYDDSVNTLNIRKCAVAVVPDIQEKIYDGEVYDNFGAWVHSLPLTETEKLMDADGFKLTLEYDGVPLYAEKYRVTITGYTTSDGLQNYVLTNIDTFETGLVISRRKVNSVTPVSIDKVYDKTAIESKGIEPGDILEQDIPFIEAVFNFYTAADESMLLDSAPVNAGDYYIRVQALSDKYGYNMLANYDLSEAEFEYADAKISPAPLTVRPVGGTFAYSGNQVNYDDMTAQNGGIKYAIVSGTLYEGDGITIGNAQIDGKESATNAGEYTVTFTAESPNYQITCDTNTLTIERLDITVTTAGGTFVYTGDPVNINTASVITVSDSVREVMTRLGHTAKETGGGEKIKNAVNVGVYDNDRTVIVTDGEGNDVSLNYRIISEGYGKVEITPATVTVGVQMRNNVYSRTYNGEPFEIALADTTATGFLKGHRLGGVLWQNIVNAGVYTDYKLTDYTVTDAAGNTADGAYSLKANYTIAYSVPTIEIKKIKLIVSPNINTRKYNGTEKKIGFDEVISNYSHIVASERPSRYLGYYVTLGGVNTTFTDAGDYTVHITEVRIADKSVFAPGCNYELESTEESYLTFSAKIDKFDLNAHGVEVVVHDLVKDYNAETYYGHQAQVVAEKMLTAYWFVGVYDTPLTVQLPNDEIVNKPDRFIIQDAGGVDRSANFTLDSFTNYTYGKLKITDKAKLKPDLEGKEYEYDASVLFDKNSNKITGKVNDGYKLKFEATVTDIEYTDRQGVVTHPDTVLGVGLYKITYDNVKYFVDGVPLDAGIAAMLEIVNEQLIVNVSVKGQNVYIMPANSDVAGVYDGEMYVEISGFEVRAYGAQFGDRFVPTKVKDNYGKEYVADANGKIYVKLTLDKVSYVKFTYVSGKMVDVNGVDISSYYRITCLDNAAYKEQKNTLVQNYGVPSNLTSGDFAVKITYEKIKLTVSVNRLPNGVEREYPYIGEKRELDFDKTDLNFFTVSGMLYSDHVMSIAEASLKATAEKENEWLDLSVSDKYGNSVNKLYDIDYVYAADTTVYVKKGTIEVTSRGGVRVNGEWLSPIAEPVYGTAADGSKVVVFDGRNVRKDESELLTPSDGYTYYKLDGATNYIKVDALGNYILFKYSATGMARRDNLTSYYNTEAI